MINVIVLLPMMALIQGTFAIDESKHSPLYRQYFESETSPFRNSQLSTQAKRARELFGKRGRELFGKRSITDNEDELTTTMSEKINNEQTGPSTEYEDISFVSPLFETICVPRFALMKFQQSLAEANHFFSTLKMLSEKKSSNQFASA
ncbi:hypothetical protein AB6A40_001386 [Gnathostoma spinigerum]|uniref:Uncharacterized protein n=1 Tax=Gnathostoma spinigerum TaxID=75299 RepID=A0ABD6EDV0_9BILA